MTHQQPRLEIVHATAPFRVDGLAMPFAEFVPRLCNLCRRLGFQLRHTMPSRAFCSDENQGIPIMLLTKHFGIFPFNHGRVGGIVAIDRHAPHAHHGEDSVIVQASHVGFDPETGAFGSFTRTRLRVEHVSASCGKITHVITPYLEQYAFAKHHILLHRDDRDNHLISVENSLVDFSSQPVRDGLVLSLEKIVERSDDGKIHPRSANSTFHTYVVSERFRQRIDAAGRSWPAGDGRPIGELLTADLFLFREDLHETGDSRLLERNLVTHLPAIVTAPSPALLAAKTNTQMEFQRTVESIRRGSEYAGKNLLFIAGLNLDISRHADYPANTFFVPWAAYVQSRDDDASEHRLPMEQERIHALLMEQDMENPDQISLSDEITRMLESPRFDIRSPA